MNSIGRRPAKQQSRQKRERAEESASTYEKQEWENEQRMMHSRSVAKIRKWEN
jgi:hypothetical protein